MLPPAIEGQLRTALATSAGGFLRNPIRRAHVTCAVCTRPVENRYSLCFRCKQHRMQSGTADIIAPITYAAAQQQSGYVMHTYKARPPVTASYHLVGMLTLFALSRHGTCVGELAGSPLTHWASVPSLPAKPGVHPLHHIATRSGSVPRAEVRLTAAPKTSDPRALDASHFSADKDLPRDSHVLLLEDTWVKGGHMQSAALSLRKAGAGRVSGLVVARWISRDNAGFLDELPDFDPDICPWTGAACPG